MIVTVTVSLRYEEVAADEIVSWMVDDLHQLFLPHLSPGESAVPRQWVEYILSKGTRIFIAIDPGKIIGVALLTSAYLFTEHIDRVEAIRVADGYSYQEVAKGLMEAIEACSDTSGASDIWVVTGADDTTARMLHGNRGYVLAFEGILRRRN